MSKQHELLAAEKTVAAAWSTVYDETLKKLANEHFFKGYVKGLKMLTESPQNDALEAAAAENKALPTNVRDTLDYAFKIYADAENLQAQKNFTNTQALADVMFRGQVLFNQLPVDELLGLETRVAKIRVLMTTMPTLDATRNWSRDPNTGAWISEPEHTVKTEKVMTPVELSPATDKHPAQVEKVTKDIPVGKVTTQHFSGACTAVQKADAIRLVDELLVELKKARMRANETAVATAPHVGDQLRTLLLSPFV
jgi:hypothetical protein